MLVAAPDSCLLAICISCHLPLLIKFSIGHGRSQQGLQGPKLSTYAVPLQEEHPLSWGKQHMEWLAGSPMQARLSRRHAQVRSANHLGHDNCRKT